MIKRLFLVAVLLLCFSDAFSQVQPFSVKFRKGEKSENVVKPEFKTRQQRFDELNRGEGIMKTAIERRFIKKGDSVRIKFGLWLLRGELHVIRLRYEITTHKEGSGSIHRQLHDFFLNSCNL